MPRTVGKPRRVTDAYIARILTCHRTREFLRLKLGALEHEVFAMIALDNRRRMIEYVELFRGTVDGASVHPREVVKAALRPSSASGR